MRSIMLRVFAVAAVAAQSYAEDVKVDFLPMLLHKPAPSLLMASAPEEEHEKDSGWAKALDWERQILLDEHGRFNKRGLYEANLHRRRNFPPQKGGPGGGPGNLSVQGQGLTLTPIPSLAWWHWTSRGPANVGGRTRALLVSPTDSQKIYAGAATGGVWVTYNGGTSWFPRTDKWANTTINSLAFDAGNNPSIIYAGTGENPYSWNQAIYGVGVMKSTNSGLDWTVLPQTTDWDAVNELAPQPNVPGVLLAGTNDGIYRTSNGGTTWTKVYPNGAGQWLRVWSLSFDSTGNNVIATGYDQTYNPRAFYSTNAGLTFNAATLPNFPDYSPQIYAAYAPGSPSTVYLHRPPNDVLISTNGGQLYAALPSLTTPICVQSDTCVMWVSPANPNLVVIGGLDLWRSTDGANSFTRISNWGLATPGGREPHADHHAIVHDPSNPSVVWFGTDGGIYKAIDINQVYSQSNYWLNRNRDYRTTQFYYAAGNATGIGRYLGGTQDNGTLMTSPTTVWSPHIAAGDAWDVYCCDGGWVAIDPTDPDYLYVEAQVFAPGRSTDGGYSAFFMGIGIDHDDRSNSNFIAPIVMDPNNPSTLMGGAGQLWRTTTAKAETPTWHSIRPYTNSPISAIAIAKGNSNIVWVGQNDGGIAKTSNATAPAGSVAWTWVSPPVGGGLPKRYVTSIYIDPASPNVVYVTLGGYAFDNVWRTADGGNTWTNIHGNLPAMPIRTIVRHPRNPQQLYVGGDVGAYSSSDGGATWSTNDQAPAEVQVVSLNFTEGTTDELMAGTHGRGLWTADVSDVPTLAPTDLFAYANGTSSITVDWSPMAGAGNYAVWRSSDGGAYVQVATTPSSQTLYTDFNVVAGKTYLYKVNTIINSVPTPYSNVDLATTKTFTHDHTLSGRTVLAIHVQEIRDAVNMVRAAAGLSPLTFSSPAGATISASDITTLRDSLTTCYTNIGMTSSPTFTNSIGYSVTIRALDYQEIRDAVK